MTSGCLQELDPPEDVSIFSYRGENGGNTEFPGNLCSVFRLYLYTKTGRPMGDFNRRK